jgi:carboxyl-terminal processing protease
VRAGERLLAVAEDETPWNPLPGRELDEVIEALRGVTGSRLRLRLGSASGESRELALHRAAVDPTRDEARQAVLTLGERRIGVVTLPVLYADFEARRRGDANARSSASDVAAMLRELKQQDVDGVLLDLRGNGGGALLEGVEVAGLFLGREPVVQVRESGGRVSVQAGSTAALWKGPLAVLVDSRSAAASEVVVAALQDHGRALVIGERSFGRDSIQTMLDLGRGSSGAGGYLTLTVGELFRVDGRSIGPDGVEPWLALPDAAAAGLREPAAGPQGACAARARACVDGWDLR